MCVLKLSLVRMIISKSDKVARCFVSFVSYSKYYTIMIALINFLSNSGSLHIFAHISLYIFAFIRFYLLRQESSSLKMLIFMLNVAVFHFFGKFFEILKFDKSKFCFVFFSSDFLSVFKFVLFCFDVKISKIKFQRKILEEKNEVVANLKNFEILKKNFLISLLIF